MNNNIFLDGKDNEVIKPDDRPIEERPSVYGVVIKQNKILLGRPKNFDRWELPGGGVEKNENDFDTLKRELLEEANCEVLKIGELVGEDESNYYDENSDKYYLAKRKYYLVEDCHFSDKTYENEIEESKLFDINNFDLNLIRIDHKRMVDKVIDRFRVRN